MGWGLALAFLFAFAPPFSMTACSSNAGCLRKTDCWSGTVCSMGACVEPPGADASDEGGSAKDASTAAD